MNDPRIRQAFQVFHGVLALGLLAMSLLSLSWLGSDMGEHLHFTFVLVLQAVAAVLLLVPRTVWWGGVLLLVVLLPGFVGELMHGDWEIERLILAAGVWFVMVHGAAWGASSE